MATLAFTIRNTGRAPITIELRRGNTDDAVAHITLPTQAAMRVEADSGSAQRRPQPVRRRLPAPGRRQGKKWFGESTLPRKRGTPEYEQAKGRLDAELDEYMRQGEAARDACEEIDPASPGRCSPTGSVPGSPVLSLRSAAGPRWEQA
jgi:hypothetical protein